jgi:hypothetical protein
MRGASFLAGTKTETLGVATDRALGRRRGRSKRLRINWIRRIPLTRIENQSQRSAALSADNAVSDPCIAFASQSLILYKNHKIFAHDLDR